MHIVQFAKFMESFNQILLSFNAMTQLYSFPVQYKVIFFSNEFLSYWFNK